MNMQRTEWMTGIGILNMALGAIGSLMSFISMNNGGMPTVMGLLMVAACFTMMAGGMGVLKRAPWGRTCVMGAGAVIAVLNLYFTVTGGFDFATVLFMMYGGAMVGLFCMPEFKNALSGQAASAVACSSDSHESSSDDVRKAA